MLLSSTKFIRTIPTDEEEGWWTIKAFPEFTFEYIYKHGFLCVDSFSTLFNISDDVKNIQIKVFDRNNKKKTRKKIAFIPYKGIYTRIYDYIYIYRQYISVVNIMIDNKQMIVSREIILFLIRFGLKEMYVEVNTYE